MWIFWLVVAGIFFIGEMITTGFLIFWLGLGAVIALIVSYLFNLNYDIPMLCCILCCIVIIVMSLFFDDVKIKDNVRFIRIPFFPKKVNRINLAKKISTQPRSLMSNVLTEFADSRPLTVRISLSSMMQIVI